MKVVIFGATRGVGQQLVEQALAQGHEVTAVARNPAAVGKQHPKLKVVQGDARDAASVERALEGQEAVLVALGPGKNAVKDGTMTICSEATPNILAGMKKHGVKRVVVCSSYGVGESKAVAGWFLNWVLVPLMLSKPFADKEKQEQQVRESGLDWVLVRPSGLHDGPAKGMYKVETDKSVPSRIARADVAAFMLKQLSESQYLRKAPSIGG